MSLNNTVKTIQDIMRKDDGVDGDAQRIGQLAWMLFLKIFDQREEEWEDDAEDRGETYLSPIPEECRWRNWAKFIEDDQGKRKPRIQASDLIAHVNNTVFPALQNPELSEDPVGHVIHSVFADTYNYMKSGSLMLDVVDKLDQGINFHDFKTRQQLGDLYEKILNDLRSAGNAGEFYTPRAVTRFMVQQVDPRLDKRETVFDPACGTGGFLTAAIDHFNAQLSDKSNAADRQAVEDCIRGIEKKQLPHLLCVTNMLLHGIDVPDQIEHANTLAKGWNDWQLNERVDCVVTNPPFGGLEDAGAGADYPAGVRTRETADMFLTLIVKKILKDGGRGAVVLPDGTLFGEGVKAKIKEILLAECNLHTIVRLPNGVFNPYTPIKTNLLFFTKGRPTETIWYYEHPYPQGCKSYSKTKPLRLAEFAAEKEWWGTEADGFAARVENEHAWKVDFKAKKSDAESRAKPHWDEAEALQNQAGDLQLKIRDLRSSVKGGYTPAIRKKTTAKINELKAQIEQLQAKASDAQAAGDRIYWPIYNLDIPNPNTPEPESHNPDELLAKYKTLLADIAETQTQLRNQLAAALEDQS